jgi:PAS domain S-box-containing protein
MSEQKRVASELDQLVAERTRELAEANDALKKELVAERQRTEAAQRASDRDARLILASIPGLVSILTPTGSVDFVNDPLVEYCGRTLEELKQWTATDAVHPEDLPRAVQIFSQVSASGEPYDFEVRLRRFDGAYRWFQIRGIPLRAPAGPFTVGTSRSSVG